MREPLICRQPRKKPDITQPCGAEKSTHTAGQIHRLRGRADIQSFSSESKQAADSIESEAPEETENPESTEAPETAASQPTAQEALKKAYRFFRMG